jgi:hypothetical protein
MSCARVSWPLFVLPLAALAACAPSADPDRGTTGEQTGRTRQDLLGDPNRFWPVDPSDGVATIPLCWNFGDWHTEKAWVEDAVANSWEKYTNVHYLFAESCDCDNNGIHIERVGRPSVIGRQDESRV